MGVIKMYDTYLIEEDDTIASISSKFNTSPEILYQLNGFVLDLVPGNTLVVPKITSDYFDYYFGFSFKEYVEPRNFISSAIFVWIMIGAIFLCLSQGNRKGVICILPTLGLWLSIMIAVPVAFSFRYVYAIFLCVPLYVLVSIRSFEKKQK